MCSPGHSTAEPTTHQHRLPPLKPGLASHVPPGTWPLFPPLSLLPLPNCSELLHAPKGDGAPGTGTNLNPSSAESLELQGKTEQQLAAVPGGMGVVAHGGVMTREIERTVPLGPDKLEDQEHNSPPPGMALAGGLHHQMPTLPLPHGSSFHVFVCQYSLRVSKLNSKGSIGAPSHLEWVEQSWACLGVQGPRRGADWLKASGGRELGAGNRHH